MTFSAERLKTLIVEDNEGDFVLIEELLLDEIRHPVFLKATSLAQTRQILAEEQGIDIILLDLTLPDASGENLVKQVLQLARQVPVIVLTGYTDKSFGIKTLAWGVADYLMKDDLQSLQLYKSIAYTIERKRIHRELENSELKYRSLFELSPLPMWVHDVNTLQFMHVNEAAVHHYGFSHAEFLAMSIKDIHPEEDIPHLLSLLEQSTHHPDLYFKEIFRHRKKNGDIIFVEVESRLIPFGNSSAKLVVANDITAKLNAEQKLRESREQLQTLNLELEARVNDRTRELTDAYRQLEAFSYSISHDLQAPLRSISGFAKLLQHHADELSEEGKVHLAYILSASKRMAELIKDLLTFTKIGKTEISKRKINTNLLVDSLWQNMPKQFPEKIQFAKQQLPDVDGDARMMEQVFVNLLSNAVKYSSKKPQQCIEVGCEETDDECWFYVRDNGAGFDMKYYDKLFGIFKRLHAVTEFEGTGLGLSIVKLIIEKHGGRVWANSELGKGATFWFSLPKS